MPAAVAEILKSSTAGAGPVLDVARPVAPTSRADTLRAIFQQTGIKPGALVASLVRLTRGPGKVSFNDFVRLRLFDPQFHSGAPLEAFVGQHRNMQLCVEANFPREWFGILRNKVAATAYLTEFGLPTIPIAAIYAPGVNGAGQRVLATRQALERFLTAKANYPLFGKPAEGVQSLGSIGLKSVSPGSREVERADGRVVPLDQLIDEIAESYPHYVFQPLVAPHPEIAAVCGSRLATARFVTLLDDDGPKIFRAAWKAPAGANVADNYWRAGNMVAQIDPTTGIVGRVISGAGLDIVEHTHHPDTGAAMTGFRHPRWEAMRALALDGARLMRHVPLIGWDIACTAEGPVIVEMNESPDFALVQLSERRGALDAEFNAFMAYRKRRLVEYVKENKAIEAKLI